MTIISIRKDTSVTGDETFVIIDQDNTQIGPVYVSEFSANMAFAKIKEQLQKNGSLKHSQIIREYILPTKKTTSCQQ